MDTTKLSEYKFSIRSGKAPDVIKYANWAFGIRGWEELKKEQIKKTPNKLQLSQLTWEQAETLEVMAPIEIPDLLAPQERLGRSILQAKKGAEKND